MKFNLSNLQHYGMCSVALGGMGMAQSLCDAGAVNYACRYGSVLYLEYSRTLLAHQDNFLCVYMPMVHSIWNTI